MRPIEIEPGLRVRFPGRPDEFDDGVEVGAASALMALGTAEFTRSVALSTVDQLRVLASKLGYHLVVHERGGDRADLVFRSGRPRATLTLVHSAPAGLASAPRPCRPAGGLRLAPSVGAPERADRSVPIS